MWQSKKASCSFSEVLLRLAYVTVISFILRFIFLAPCSFTLREFTLKQFHYGRSDVVRSPKKSSKSIPSYTSAIPHWNPKEFFLHIHQGVIVRRNITNFQPFSIPPSLYLLGCTFKSSTSRRRRRPRVSFFLSLSFSQYIYARKDHNTTARGPIFPTHNLQFHILFPSRLTRGLDKLVSTPPLLANHPPGHVLIYSRTFRILYVPGPKRLYNLCLQVFFLNIIWAV